MSHDIYLCVDCAKDFFNNPTPLDDRVESRRIEELFRETLANMQAPDKKLAVWKMETRAEILEVKQQYEYFLQVTTEELLNEISSFQRESDLPEMVRELTQKSKAMSRRLEAVHSEAFNLSGTIAQNMSASKLKAIEQKVLEIEVVITQHNNQIEKALTEIRSTFWSSLDEGEQSSIQKVIAKTFQSRIDKKLEACHKENDG